MKQIKFSIDDDLHKEVCLAAQAVGLSLAAFVRLAALEKARVK